MSIIPKGLSVAIIAKNAEKTIARTLQSVVSIASEVVVVINDCDDDTKAIAESYGAHVFEHDWEGFREQKNFAISLTTNEWILSLDADEELSPQLANSIKNFILTDDPKYVAAKIPRRTFLLGKPISYGDWYPDYGTRLFKRAFGKFVGGSVHERLEIDGNIRYLAGDILHYSGESAKDFIERNLTYSELWAKDAFARGKTTSMFSMIFNPFWRFLRGYVLKLGFLDGTRGYFVAKMQAFFALYKHFRLWAFLQKDGKTRKFKYNTFHRKATS